MDTRVGTMIGAMVWTLMLAGVPAAQSKVAGLASGTQLNPGSVSPGGADFIVIGCVSREDAGGAENFVITDSRATPPVQYRLQGDANLLRIHVAHTVEIGGSITPPAAGAKPPATLGVKALTYIATTCKPLK